MKKATFTMTITYNVTGDKLSDIKKAKARILKTAKDDCFLRGAGCAGSTNYDCQSVPSKTKVSDLVFKS